MVHHFAKLAARLEERHAARAHIDRCAAFGIAAGARLPDADLEAAETSDFDPVTFRKGVRHAVEDRVHYDFDVPRRKILKFFADRFNQITLVQGPLLFVTRDS